MKKYLSYILILIAIIGLLGITQIKSVSAQSSYIRPSTNTTTNTTSTPDISSAFTTTSISTSNLNLNTNVGGNTLPSTVTDMNGNATTLNLNSDNSNVSSTSFTNLDGSPQTTTGVAGTDGTTGQSSSSTPAATTPAQTNNTVFTDTITQLGCMSFTKFSMSACLAQGVFYGIYVPSSFLLWASGYFFNAIVSITLSSALLSSAFVSQAWGVVRDLSNLFFILILLYISIQLILDIGGHDSKKMIARVIIIALLINFSMFFTEVVVDSSNILALIFYNKLQVDPQTGARIYAPASGERDVSGGMMGAFDPTKAMTPTFFAKLANTSTDLGAPKNSDQTIPPSMLIGITLLASAIMIFAIYAFFISGLSFVGRLIELFVLIIFSPFAFMSFTVPQLEHIPDIGWDAWLKRLLAASFMAPIFMFFLYFIFLLIRSNIFTNMIPTNTNSSAITTLLSIAIPALLILVLLLKAADYAKKGSGKFGEMVMKGAQMVGGLAVGAATGGASLAMGGAALLATKGIGGYYKNIANDDELRKKAAGGDKDAIKRLATANSMASKSFDFRQTGMGKFVSKQTGMNIDRSFGIKALSTEQLKGGATASEKRATEKEDARNESYKMTKKEAEIQDRLAKDGKQPQNIRAGQYEKDKNEAKRLNPNLDEEKFKEKYEKGVTKEEMEEFGIEHGVAEGSVEKIKTSAQVNQDRRTAYANSLDKNNEEAKGAMRTFRKEFMKGSGISGWKSAGLSLGAAVATGGVSAVVQIGSGLARGGIQSGRTAAANSMDGTTNSFLKAFKEVVRPSGGRPTSETIATIRKEDPNKEFKKIFSDLKAGKNVSEENKGKLAEKIISTGNPTTPPDHPKH